MCQFFSSTFIILLGGFLSLVFARQKKFSRAIAVLLLSGGSLLGLLDAAGKLLNPSGASASFRYLDLFFLSFHVDGLSAFFLTAIFAVSLMAAIYSFHYMENEEGGIKTGVNYFFLQCPDRFHGTGGDRRQYPYVHDFMGNDVPVFLFSGDLQP